MHTSKKYLTTSALFLCLLLHFNPSWTYAVSIPIPETIAIEEPTPPSESSTSDFGFNFGSVIESVTSLVRSLNHGVAVPESDQTDWSCQPSEQHPYPVVILHGLFAPGFESWRVISKRLSEVGYCVYQLKYGMIPGFETLGGLSDIRISAKELDSFISKVLTATSAQKVDLIGHSLGTVVARWYLKYLDRQMSHPQQNQTQQQREPRVRSLVSIAPIGRGTSIQGLLPMIQTLGTSGFIAETVQQYCTPCVQVLEGSSLLKALYGRDGLQGEVPGVQYLNIVTNHDNIVTPFTNGIMTLPESKSNSKPKSKSASTSDTNTTDLDTSLKLKNLVIEDYCDYNPEYSSHCGIFQSPFAFHATNAFLSTGLMDLDAVSLSCTL
ncbi:hypothetical protein FBU30_008709 [Linnemannia zychae]|nr:hypothetical protein FBU30_008709 [Linnemannia zychae]